MDFIEDRLILCGRCRIPVQIANCSDCETQVRCPRCGHCDSLEQARREANQHTAHMLLSSMLRGVGTSDRPELFFHFVEGDGGPSGPSRA